MTYKEQVESEELWRIVENLQERVRNIEALLKISLKFVEKAKDIPDTTGADKSPYVPKGK